MKQLNLYEAKTQLSALVDQAAEGEEIVICKNGKPMARLVKLPEKTPPQFGAWSGLGWDLPEDFDAPDEEIERMFYGEDYDELVARCERGDVSAGPAGAGKT